MIAATGRGSFTERVLCRSCANRWRSRTRVCCRGRCIFGSMYSRGGIGYLLPGHANLSGRKNRSLMCSLRASCQYLLACSWCLSSRRAVAPLLFTLQRLRQENAAARQSVVELNRRMVEVRLSSTVCLRSTLIFCCLGCARTGSCIEVESQGTHLRVTGYIPLNITPRYVDFSGPIGYKIVSPLRNSGT
jgi:hypothetical protein